MALNASFRSNGFWYEEQITEELVLRMAFKQVLFDENSEFQRVQIINTGPFGKTLVLDDHTQSSQSDEHIYHESLVHPAMMAHGSPKTVFIGGGGEGATAREVLKWKSVEKVVMVDIDEVACKMCQKHLPEWNAGVYEDARFEIHYKDAYSFLQDYNGPSFDVVIMDIADPIECGPGIALYFKEFYENVMLPKMSEDGVFVTQSGACGILNYREVFTTIHNTLKTSFKETHGYTVEVPSFGCPWGFNLCYNHCSYPAVPDWNPSDTTKRLAESLKAGEAERFQAYDGIGHRSLFALPKWVRDGCAEEKRVMCEATPVFLT